MASVKFATTVYEYNENDGAINNIEVVLNAPVAQDFTVHVTGGILDMNNYHHYVIIIQVRVVNHQVLLYLVLIITRPLHL